ncbi:hypothetical protein P9112_007567 [Eukaryota sp. TZLM1-RC]
MSLRPRPTAPLLDCDPVTDPSTFLPSIRKGDQSLYFYDMPLLDHPRRADLLKNHFLDHIGRLAGASLVVRGSSTPRSDERPLYLHITARNNKAVANAVALIYDTIEGHIEYPEEHSSAPNQRPKEESSAIVSINIVNPPPSFNLRAKVLGREGTYVKHISSTTGCRVQLKGLGSQYMDPATGKEEPVPLYMYITGPSDLQVNEAKELGESLAGAVRKEYERYRSNVKVPKEGGSSYSEFLQWARQNPDGAQTFIAQMKNLYQSTLAMEQTLEAQNQPSLPIVEEDSDMDIEMESDSDGEVREDEPPLKVGRTSD